MLLSSRSYVKRLELYWTRLLKSETGTGRLDWTPLTLAKIRTTRLDSVGTGFIVTDLKQGLAD